MKTPYELRKERSNTLLQTGVEPALDGEETFWVPAQSQKGKYKVSTEEGRWACSCPDHAKTGFECKHIFLCQSWLTMRHTAKKTQSSTAISQPCSSCDSVNLQKDGTRKTTMGRKQKWLCRDCGSRFVNDPLGKTKGNEEAIITAIDLYMKGVSYRGIADSLRQFYGLTVTHVTVLNWVQRYMSQINAYADTFQPNVGDTWHADEQFIKANGKQEYVWNVMDGNTRFLLASNESPTRNYNDARKTFQQAKKAAGKKATTVVTDGAFNYKKAVQKEFATYKNPKPHARYVSLRQKSSNNNNIERFHGTFRQRDKVMKGFGGNQKAHAENFRTYYNFIKKHKGLQGQTPAQKAGIRQEGLWKEMLNKATCQPSITSRP